MTGYTPPGKNVVRDVVASLLRTGAVGGQTKYQIAERCRFTPEQVYQSGIRLLQIEQQSIVDLDELPDRFLCRDRVLGMKSHIYFWGTNAVEAQKYGWLRDKDNATRTWSTGMIHKFSLDQYAMSKDEIISSWSRLLREVGYVLPLLSQLEPDGAGLATAHMYDAEADMLAANLRELRVFMISQQA